MSMDEVARLGGGLGLVRKGADMPASILVAYATRYGSTQEVAEAIGSVLRGLELEVDVQPIGNVATPAGYAAVVLGAPLYMAHWHKDALRFLTRHEETLMQKPVAVFALGPVSEEEKEWRDAREQLNQELAKFPKFAPMSVRVFGGKYDLAKLRFPWNLIPAMKKLPASDVRDWEAITAWAIELAAKLESADNAPPDQKEDA
jgi:menaquinone-dependent protoporphyrinogen oxidase